VIPKRFRHGARGQRPSNIEEDERRNRRLTFFLVALTLFAMAGMMIGLVARITQNAPPDGTAVLAFVIVVCAVWLVIVRRMLRHDAKVIREDAKIR